MMFQVRKVIFLDPCAMAGAGMTLVAAAAAAVLSRVRRVNMGWLLLWGDAAGIAAVSDVGRHVMRGALDGVALKACAPIPDRTSGLPPAQRPPGQGRPRDGPDVAAGALAARG